MIPQEIYLLLKENTRVMIPEFGAFMMKSLTDNTLIFNEYLKFNDSLLVDHLMQKFKIDKAHALKMIKNFFDSVQKELMKEKKCVISPLGVLTLDENDKILFTPTAVAEIKNPNTEITEPQSIINETVLPKLPYQEEKSGHLHHFKDIAENVPENNKNKTSDNMETTVDQNVSQDQDTLSGYNYKPRRVRPGYKIKSLIILVVGLIITILYFAIFKNSDLKTFLGKKQQVKNETIILDNKVSEKTEPGKTEIKKDMAPNSTSSNVPSVKQGSPKPKATKTPEKAEPVKKSIAASKSTEKKAPLAPNQQPLAKTAGSNYYIILGTFVQPQNANRFIADLKLKGYDTQIVYKKGEYSFVGLSPIATKTEAFEKLKVIQNAGITAWMMKK